MTYLNYNNKGIKMSKTLQLFNSMHTALTKKKTIIAVSRVLNEKEDSLIVITINDDNQIRLHYAHKDDALRDFNRIIQWISED